jgi:phosphatidate cytidylyltransferase
MYKDLKIRTLVSIVLIAIVVYATLYSRLLFAGFFSLAGLLVLREMLMNMSQNKAAPSLTLAFPLYALFLAKATGNIAFPWELILITSAIFLFTIELAKNKAKAFENISLTGFSALFVALAIHSFIALQQYDLPMDTGVGFFGGRLILSVFISVWVCDGMAYFVGSAIGKHKIFPRVSPNKSWEGSIAGLLSAILVLFLLSSINFVHGFEAWHLIILGIIAGGMGQVGDFAESLIKRDLGIKDSSNLLPGHGGAWDRLDSLLFAIPLSYYFIKYFVL